MQGKRGKANSWARLRGTLEAEGTVVAGECFELHGGGFQVVYEENSEKELETRGSRVGRGRGQEAPDSTRCSPAGPAGPGPSLASPVPWPCRGGVLRVVPDTRPRRHRSEPGREWSEWEGSVGAGWLRSGNAGPELGGESRTVMPSRGSRGREDRGAAPGQPERGTGAAAAAEEARSPRLHSPGAGAAGGGVSSRGGHKGR